MKGQPMKAKPNALQAVIDRAAAEPKTEAPPEATAERPPKRRRSQDPAGQGRGGRVLIGGHFPPAVSKQLAIIAAEEGMTKQDLLQEALDLLFVKKGKTRIRDL